MTDNHQYNEPTLGDEEGWGTLLNTNFQDLDTDVEIRDTDANKGNYTPKDGAFFRATDTGAIYKGNGSSWVLADIDTDAVSANSVETDQAHIPGPVTNAITSITWDRPRVLTSDTTVQVPQDESTIQDALRKVPMEFWTGEYRIQVDVSQGPYSEDVVIPSFSAEVVGDGTEGDTARLIIEDQGSGNDVVVDSVFNIASRGGRTSLTNIQTTTTNPWDDETAAFVSYGGAGRLFLSGCSIGGSLGSGSTGVLSYSSDVKVQSGFDFGTDNVETGVEEKQGGQMVVKGTINGTVTGDLLRSPTGRIVHQGNLPSSSGSGTAKNIQNNATVGTKLFLTEVNTGTVYSGLRANENDDTVIGHPVIGDVLTFNDGADRALLESLALQFSGARGPMWKNKDNLAGKTGTGATEIRVDDGTNTPSGEPEPCYWMESTSQWRPWTGASDGSDDFS